MGTPHPRIWSSTLETVPSPPETTTAIELANVRYRVLGLHAIADKTHHDLVAALREGVRERVDFI